MFEIFAAVCKRASSTVRRFPNKFFYSVVTLCCLIQWGESRDTPLFDSVEHHRLCILGTVGVPAMGQHWVVIQWASLYRRLLGALYISEKKLVK